MCVGMCMSIGVLADECVLVVMLKLKCVWGRKQESKRACQCMRERGKEREREREWESEKRMSERERERKRERKLVSWKTCGWKSYKDWVWMMKPSLFGQEKQPLDQTIRPTYSNFSWDWKTDSFYAMKAIVS